MGGLRRVAIRMLFLAFPPAVAACGGGETEMDETAVDTAEMEMAMEAEDADALAGTYPAAMGTVEFRDGRYTYRAAEGDSILVQGEYMIRGDTVHFVDESGPIACPGEHGIYTFRMEMGEPELTLVSDPCEGRRREITGEDGGS